MESLEQPHAAKPEKRFELSREEFAQKRISALKDTVGELKREDPAVLSFTMYGSMARGNPHEKSDIDGYLFVDADTLAEEVPEEERANILTERGNHEGMDTRLSPRYEDQYRDKFASMMTERSDMEKEQVLDGLKVRPVSAEIVNRHIADLVGSKRAIEAYETEHAAWESSPPADRTDLKALIAYREQEPQHPKLTAPSTSLYGMFHLDVGGGISKYREQVIEELSKQGEAGEAAWGDIIQNTDWLENYLSDSDKHMPRTLEEARKVYTRAGREERRSAASEP